MANKLTYECDECGKEFERYDRGTERTFCKRACYREWLQKNRKGRKNYGRSVETICSWCGEDLKRTPYQLDKAVNGVFCNIECSGAFRAWRSVFPDRTSPHIDTENGVEPFEPTE